MWIFLLATFFRVALGQAKWPKLNVSELLQLLQSTFMFSMTKVWILGMLNDNR